MELFSNDKCYHLFEDISVIVPSATHFVPELVKLYRTQRMSNVVPHK